MKDGSEPKRPKVQLNSRVAVEVSEVLGEAVNDSGISAQTAVEDALRMMFGIADRNSEMRAKVLREASRMASSGKSSRPVHRAGNGSFYGDFEYGNLVYLTDGTLSSWQSFGGR